MHLLLLWLRKLLGVLLVAIGVLAGLVGGLWTLVFASLWFRGEHLSQGDRTGWLACAGGGVVGGLVLWAGAALLRTGGAGPANGRSLRLNRTGPQRRRSAYGTAWDTFVCLMLGAELLWFPLRIPPVARVYPVLMGVGAIYLGFQAIFLCHELGHLLVAAVLGFDLQTLQIGTGLLLFKGKLGGLRVEWRALLGGGFVRTADVRERGWRWRHWAYVAGGPAAHAVGCGGLAWWVWRHNGGAWIPRGLSDRANTVALYLLFLAVLHWLYALVPKEARVGSVRTRSDGSKLLSTPRLSQEGVRITVIATGMHRVAMLWEEDRRDAAWKRLHEFQARYPSEPLLRALEGHYLAEQGDYAAAAAIYQHWLKTAGLSESARRMMTGPCFSFLARAVQPEAARQWCAHALREVAPASRVALLDSLATAVLSHELHPFLPEADAWSREALALEPQKITLKGTRGSVLVELGRLDEGEALLKEVWATSDSEVDAAISAFYLGVVAKRRQRRHQFFLWFGRSKSFAPSVGRWLTERIARELVPGSLGRTANP